MHYHTLRNTAAFLITTFACFNSAHAASKLVNIGTKQPEVKEIPQPPQELRDALNIHIGTSTLQHIIYDYLRGSEIHEDHARLLRFMHDRIINTEQKTHLSEFKCVYDYDDNSDLVSAADKKWIESYVRVGLPNGLKQIKNERNTENNFFAYGFDNLIILNNDACIQQHNQHLLEYLLSNCDHIKPQPMDMEVVEQIITLLIESKAPVNTYLEGQSKTPLRSAIDDFKSPALVQLMLEHKANPNYRCYDSLRYDLLHGADYSSDYSLYPKCSYLHRVNENSHPQIVQSLLQAKADVYTTRIQDCPLLNALDYIHLIASIAQRKALAQDATEDDRNKAEKLALFVKMFEDAARAQQKHLKQDD